jgi:CubicO group peptidase (beta-lactamase class C family)
VRLGFCVLLSLLALATGGGKDLGCPCPERREDTRGPDQETRGPGLERLHSLVVSHRGQIVSEYYARGHSATRPANIKSASKSVISTLVGIAIERKLIPGLDTTIVRWFPELRTDPDRRKQAITIEDLLTMRSGLASTSGEQCQAARHHAGALDARVHDRFVIATPSAGQDNRTRR